MYYYQVNPDNIFFFENEIRVFYWIKSRMVGYKIKHDLDSKHLCTSKINHDLISFIVLQYNLFYCTAIQSFLLYCNTIFVIVLQYNLFYCNAIQSVLLYCNTIFFIILQYNLFYCTLTINTICTWKNWSFTLFHIKS